MKKYSLERNAECLCGSGRKFKNCCLPYIENYKGYELTIHEMNNGNFDEALRLCRADLTKYLINVKSYTEPLLFEKPEAGKWLLEIDLKALSEIIDKLMRIIKLGNLPICFQNDLDRLENVFDNTDWHFRLIYYKVAWEYFYQNNELSAKRFLDGISYKDINDLDFLQMYYDLLAHDLSFSQKNEVLDKLVSLEETYSGKIKYLGNKGLTYFLIGDSIKAKEIFIETIKMAESNLEKFIDSYDYFQLAMTYNFAGKLVKDESLLHKSIEFFQKSSKVDEMTPSGYAMIYRHLGDVYSDLGESEKALEQYFLSLKQYENPILKILIAGVYLDKNDFIIGKNYLEMVNYEGLNDDDKLDYLFTMSKLVIIQKDNETARFVYEKLKELDLDDKYFNDIRNELMNDLLELYKDFTSKEPLEKSRIKALLEKINEYIILQPNAFGLGINFNNIVNDLLKNK